MTAPALVTAIHTRLGSFNLDVEFSVGRELLVLFGHSGSGKSVTLRAIAGLLTPDAGRISIDGTTVFDHAQRINVPPQRRGAGLVVQNYALFPHLTVAQNIAFGLRGSKAEHRARVAELCDLLGLDGLQDRRPAQISGGQAQRVALARALAPRPRLLLLDEPFSALDSAIRVGLRRELARLKRDLDLTIVFVTHDLREAYNLADRIAVFDAGRTLQTGPRDAIFNTPRSARVAQLMEVRNIWRGRVTAATPDGVEVEVPGFTIRSATTDFAPGQTVDVCIRPERVLLLRAERHPDEAIHDRAVTATIADETAHGASYTLFFRPHTAPPDAPLIEVDLPAHPYDVMDVRTRRTWTLVFPRTAVHTMPTTQP